MAPKVIINFNPQGLEIGDHIDEHKLVLIAKNGWMDEIVVLPDFDGTLYVVDGTHRATIALRNGEPISGILAEDDYRLGPQTAIERAIGIFCLRKES